MTRVRDEIGDVLQVRQVAGKWCGRIEDDNHRAGLEPVDDLMRHCPDRCIGNRHNNDVRPFEAFLRSDAVDTEHILQAGFCRLIDLYMSHLESQPVRFFASRVPIFPPAPRARFS